MDAAETTVIERPKQRNPWLLVAALFVVALVNYFDRQSLSVVAPRFQRELGMSDEGYGHVVSLFLFASTIAYALSGFVADALGSRKAMALFVGWWSLA
jgi:MFS transporter, ACS family, hexuronate transporter